MLGSELNANEETNKDEGEKIKIHASVGVEKFEFLARDCLINSAEKNIFRTSAHAEIKYKIQPQKLRIFDITSGRTRREQKCSQ